MYISKTRSVIKAISWRIVGTLDTMALGWLITGNPIMGLKIGALELCTKFVLIIYMKEFGLNLNSEQKRKNLSLDFIITKIFFIFVP